MASDTTVTIPNARLAADPTIETSKNGKQYMQLRFATTPYHRDKQTNQIVQGTTEWWKTVEFDTRQMQTYMAQLHKGDSIMVEGILEIGTYVDRDGVTQIDRSVKFSRIRKNLPRAKQQQQQGGQFQQQPQQQQPQGVDPYASPDFNAGAEW